MKSMTGFGRSQINFENIQCTIEIKTVNSRFCDIYLKFPKSFNALEDGLRKIIQNHIQRGKVECSLQLKEVGDAEKSISINQIFCEQIKQFLVETKFYKSKDEVPLNAVMQVSKDWLQIEDIPIAEEILEISAKNALLEALRHLDEMRCREGENIKLDLLDRVDYLEAIVKEIDFHKDAAVKKYEERLQQRIEDLLTKSNLEITSDRFLQEIAIMVDKTDITEEIVRFKSHVVQLKNTFTEDGPIGRKLDFLLQEMNREVNTMGSKGADLEITDRVILLKNELEKIREQIQNIE